MDRGGLAMSVAVDVHTTSEDFVDPEEAEAAIKGGAFEGRAASGEGDALRDGRAASELDFCFDAVGFQIVGEVFPIA